MSEHDERADLTVHYFPSHNAPLISFPDLPSPISREHVSILALRGEPLFFQHFDGPYYPTLRLLHKCKPSLTRTDSGYGIGFRLTNLLCVASVADLRQPLSADSSELPFLRKTRAFCQRSRSTRVPSNSF